MGRFIWSLSSIVLLICIEGYSALGLLDWISSFLGRPISVVLVLIVIGLRYLAYAFVIQHRDKRVVDRPNWVNSFSAFALISSFTLIFFALLLALKDIFLFLMPTLFGLIDYSVDLEYATLIMNHIVGGSSLALFLTFWLGHSFGRYRYRVENVYFSFPNLPENFHGFKIAQISDAHSGSWDSPISVAKGLKRMQDEQPDMIVFTGDLVNGHKDEIDPFIDSFKCLSAPFGKFAVLGNHDYYGQPRDRAERQVYWEDFRGKYEMMGFDLMMNESRIIKRGDQQIALLGVENWGAGRWFPKKGDLSKAIDGLASDLFFILLSHDPSHWEKIVLEHPQDIQLTLSGHTHGLQFGIKFKSFSWSPMKYRLKHWYGTYEQLGQKLYINRGFGYLAYPGRVGMWPEITLITLLKADFAEKKNN